jgi:hypothetical protein
MRKLRDYARPEVSGDREDPRSGEGSYGPNSCVR